MGKHINNPKVNPKLHSLEYVNIVDRPADQKPKPQVAANT
jgi:hypothetical protein